MQSNETTMLCLQNIPDTAAKAHVFPDITEHSLLSIGQLCDAGCLATFDATSVNVIHNDTTIRKGTRDQTTKL